jgi:hypothetical protein
MADLIFWSVWIWRELALTKMLRLTALLVLGIAIGEIQNPWIWVPLAAVFGGLGHVWIREGRDEIGHGGQA